MRMGYSLPLRELSIADKSLYVAIVALDIAWAWWYFMSQLNGSMHARVLLVYHYYNNYYRMINVI